MNSKTKKITTTGVLLALGTILSLIKVFELPYGGSITLAEMVPVIIIGYKYGPKWGLASGTLFGIIQAILGATTSQAFAGQTGLSLVLMALLDYIVAFAVLGLGGIFKNKIKNDTAAIAAGGAVAVLLRLAAHFLSGWILWGSYAEWFFTDVMNNSFGQKILSSYTGQLLAVIYSLVYNASYMLPNLVVTVVVLVAIMAVKPIRKYIVNENA